MTQKEVDREIATYIREHPDEELRARNVAIILIGKGATDNQIANGFLHNNYSDAAARFMLKSIREESQGN